MHSDHLGSPELITNSSGTELVRPSFAAYGERRDGSDWDGPPSSADLTAIGNTSRRGFTGHEHLDAVGLIHMNGRVYEPVAGRFLSVDPLIDGFDSSQGPNSFSYVHNNPLTFSDPFGLSHNCNGEDVTSCSHDDGGWDECHWGGPWMAGWSPSCEDQYYLGPQGDEVVDITGPGSGQNPTPLTPAEAWDGVISGGTAVVLGVKRRMTLPEYQAHTQRHIDELKALVAMGDGTTSELADILKPSLWDRYQAWRQGNLDRTAALLDAALAGNEEAQFELLMGAIGGKGRIPRSAVGHSFEKHVLGVGARVDDPLFRGLGIRTMDQLARHIEQVLANPTAVKSLRFGRTAYWHEATSSVLIRNSLFPSRSTIFQPSAGREYFEGLR